MFKETRTRDTWRQAGNLIFALTQIAAGYVFTIFAVGRSLNSSAAAYPTPVIPAGYAFSIWGIIFLFSLAYAIYQLLPSQRENSLLRRLGWFTASAFFFNTVWELVAQLVTFNWPTLFIIVLILVSALAAFFRLPAYRKLERREKWLVFTPVSLLAGWVSAATFVNLSSVLNQLNFNNFGFSLAGFSLLIIALACLFAAFILYKSGGNVLYGLTVIWALVAILVANLTRAYEPGAAILAGIFALVVLVELYLLNL